ncbi:MAG TPA: hypothetical protein VHE36_02380 [Sphingomicrobium sp.]|jgi:hypothetical protein|nr:hypothetical protein [Sphingomicrobium sp.]
MANPKLAPLLILALVPGACGARSDHAPTGSVTVELPPARAATARPGFRSESPEKAGDPAGERASAAVHELARNL